MVLAESSHLLELVAQESVTGYLINQNSAMPNYIMCDSALAIWQAVVNFGLRNEKLNEVIVV